MVHSVFIGLLLFEHCAQKWVSLSLMVILRKLRKKNVLHLCNPTSLRTDGIRPRHPDRTNQDKMTTPYGFSTKSERITTSVALCQKIPFSVILQWNQLQGDHGILAPERLRKKVFVILKEPTACPQAKSAQSTDLFAAWRAQQREWERGMKGEPSGRRPAGGGCVGINVRWWWTVRIYAESFQESKWSENFVPQALARQI
jgi:hypothetical protein